MASLDATQATVNGARCGIRLHKGNATVIAGVQLLRQPLRAHHGHLWRRRSFLITAPSEGFILYLGTGCRPGSGAASLRRWANQRKSRWPKNSSSSRKPLIRPEPFSKQSQASSWGMPWLFDQKWWRCCG